MIKKLTLALVLLTAAFLVPTFAQTDAATEKQAAVKELIALIGNDNQAEELVNLFIAQMEVMEDATIKTLLDERADLTAADRRAVEELLLSERRDSKQRFQDKLMKKINLNEMLLEIVTVVYDKNYTLEEIRDLITFYKTPTGQKAVRMMTPIMTDTLQLTQERLLTKLPAIIKEIEAENRKELEQKINARKPKPKNKKSE